MSDGQEKQNASGAVTGDPSENASDGDTMGFGIIRAHPKASEEVVVSSNWSEFDGAILAISFSGSSQNHVEGSAVMVAPGVAITATHILEPRLLDLQSGKIWMMCLGIAKHGLVLWSVRKLTIIPNSDVTLLMLQLASNYPPNKHFFQVGLTTRLPKIGDRVAICGFRANALAFPVIDGMKAEVQGSVLVSQGKITNRYPDGRDRVMLPWPVFEVESPTWGGMSGGPVFDESGYIVGVLSSSFDLGNGTGISYVSLLWSAMATPISPVWPKGPHENERSLVDMHKLCEIERREVISRIVDEDSKRVLVRCNIWES